MSKTLLKYSVPILLFFITSTTVMLFMTSSDTNINTIVVDIPNIKFAMNNTSIPITFGGADITFTDESAEKCDYVSYNVEDIVFPMCIRKSGYISSFIRAKHEWIDCHELNDIIKHINSFIKFEFTTISLFIDVGANIGSCSFTVASSAYYNTNDITQIIAFEPLQSNLFYFKHTLSKNVKLFNNIVLVECAAGSHSQEDEKRSRTIIVNSRNKGDARIEPISAVNNSNKSKYNSYMPVSPYVGKSDKFEQQQICLSTIDSVLLYLKNKNMNYIIPLMKIDVQGYEKDVLLGAQKLIEMRNVFCIRFEFDPYMIKQVGANPLKLLQFVHSNGYDIYMTYDMNKRKDCEINDSMSCPFAKQLGPDKFEFLIQKYTTQNKFSDLYALLRINHSHAIK